MKRLVHPLQGSLSRFELLLGVVLTVGLFVTFWRTWMYHDWTLTLLVGLVFLLSLFSLIREVLEAGKPPKPPRA